MLSWFKRYFIPHEENDHKPHFLRGDAVLILLGIVLVTEISFLVFTLRVIPNSNFLASLVPSVLVNLTNESRSLEKLSTLAPNPVLELAAKKKAEDMAQKGYFAHTSPEGRTPWYWVQEAGYKYSYAGENLAVNFFDSKDVVEAWMRSPGHRANIVNNNYTEIGIALASGMYQGHEATFVVQYFGRPSKEIISAHLPQSTFAPSVSQVKGVYTKEIPTQKPITIAVVRNTQESFAEVSGENDHILNSVPIEKPLENIFIEEPSLLARLVSTPRGMTNFLYIVLFTIVLTALVLSIVIKIKIQHPQIIMHGVLVLLVIAVMLLANQFLSLEATKII